MTEKEAMRILGDTTLCSPLGQAAFRVIECMKELQGYREIGAEKVKNIMALLSIENEKDVIEMLKELSQYREIGTVKECRAAVEKLSRRKGSAI